MILNVIDYASARAERRIPYEFATLVDWATEDRYQLDLEVAVPEFFVSDDLMTSPVASEQFWAWFIFDRPLCLTGKTVLQEYLELQGPSMAPADYEILRSWFFRKSGIYYLDNEGIARDFTSGARYPLVNATWLEVEPDSPFFTRLLPVGDQYFALPSVYELHNIEAAWLQNGLAKAESRLERVVPEWAWPGLRALIVQQVQSTRQTGGAPTVDLPCAEIQLPLACTTGMVAAASVASPAFTLFPGLFSHDSTVPPRFFAWHNPSDKNSVRGALQIAADRVSLFAASPPELKALRRDTSAVIRSLMSPGNRVTNSSRRVLAVDQLLAAVSLGDAERNELRAFWWHSVSDVKPRFNRPEPWAAAVLWQWRQNVASPVTQAEAARVFGVSSQALRGPLSALRWIAPQESEVRSRASGWCALQRPDNGEH
jgi:hypothetical protein